MPRLVCAIVLATLLGACRDTTLPPAPADVRKQLQSCKGSTIQGLTDKQREEMTLADLAEVGCKLDQRLDSTATLASSAATVCAHALKSYDQPLPQFVGAARSDNTGVDTCARTQSQCGYAFFIKQSDPDSSRLELLGPAGCSTAKDAGRGALFACCTVPASIPIPGPGTPGSGPVTHLPTR